MLYNTVGSDALGRVLCAIFFLGLIFAGISSLIAIMEVVVHVLNDFGSEWSGRSLLEFVTQLLQHASLFKFTHTYPHLVNGFSVLVNSVCSSLVE